MSLKPMNWTVCDLGDRDAEANDMNQKKPETKEESGQSRGRVTNDGMARALII